MRYSGDRISFVDGERQKDIREDNYGNDEQGLGMVNKVISKYLIIIPLGTELSISLP